MKRPTNPGRKRGKAGEQRLSSITYSQIADWVGLTPRTIRAYACRGDFDNKSLESTLQWVNTRRQSQGLPPIGQPQSQLQLTSSPVELDTPPTGTVSLTPVLPPTSESYCPRSRITIPLPPTLGLYNPITGTFPPEE